MTNFPNLDAAESMFFARQLEHIKSTMYDVTYPELKARQFIPVDSSAGDGANLITYRQRDVAGRAKVIADYADDAPRVNMSAKEFSQRVYDIGVSFGYSLREIRSAARLGTDLDSESLNNAREAAERELDEIAATGHASADLKGFVTHPLVSDASVANPGSGTTWAVKTSDQILTDLNEPVSTIRSATKGQESPTTILVPEEQYTLIAQKRMTDLNVTVLDFFLSSNPFITEVLPWYRLDGAGESSADRMIVYKRSPDVLSLEIPREFEVLDSQQRNFEIVTNAWMATGGVIVYKPKAILYRDGI